MRTLLNREQFRNAVFDRDNHKCVVCNQPAQDAHHLIERALWTSPLEQGGYFLNNGVSLCGLCHLRAESTEFSVEYLREKAGITKIELPEQLYEEYIYTKWGDIVHPDGTRTPGERFHDYSVQKVIKQYLHLYSPYIKYPRTFHLPWSEGRSKDDRILLDTDQFEGSHVTITEKMDGENTTIYSNYIHARSLTSESHPSQSWVRALASRIGYQLPEGMRICGENLYAKHAIPYNDLSSYFMVFSIWDGNNSCLSWGETVEWCQLLELETVPVIYQGKWDEKLVRDLYTQYSATKDREVEGYVVRLSEDFPYSRFRQSVAKYVRANHVAATVHNWKRTTIVPNQVRYE